MILFWIAAVVLAIAAGVLIAMPLWRPRSVIAPSAAEVNLSVHRDQLQELDADLKGGSITQIQYDAARKELEKRVLKDATGDEGASGMPHPSSRAFAMVLFVLVPIAALSLYGLLGNPKAIDTSKHAGADISSMTPEHFAALTEKLAAKLAQDPSDATAWLMLAKAYKVLDRAKDAAAALEKGVQLKPDDPEMLTEYAEVVAVAQGGNFAGKPEQAIVQVLKLAPNHPKALTMAGAVAFEKKNYSAAIAHWQKLHKLVKNDVELQKALLAGIAEASRLRTVANTPAQAITGRVQLHASLTEAVDPADTVFVFARAAEGPGMPVAALRKQARDLPFTFRLDDTYALNPSARLGSLPSIVVGVRISKSGDAMPQPGDLQAYSSPVKLGASAVVLTIKDVVQKDVVQKDEVQKDGAQKDEVQKDGVQ